MKREHFWLWFHEAPGISRNKKWEMLEYFGSPQEIYNVQEKHLESFFRSENNLQKFLISKNEESVSSAYNKLIQNQISFIYAKHKLYPEKFKCISEPPLAIYVKGKLPKQDKLTVAIIGARECTRYGKEMARFFGRELGKAGVSIISGLARGIDGMAHQGAIEANAYTVGVLGCGINVVYPNENYQLFMHMQKQGGVISEYGLDVKPYAALFPNRNRLIAGLADGILVVEAMEKSGTFITVDQGLEQGKEIFALPGRVIDRNSQGCNNLIKMGAHMVTEVSDILEILHINDSKTMTIAQWLNPESFISKNLLAPNEKIVYSCLRVEPQYLDEIIRKAQIAPQEVCMSLNHLVVIGGAVETTRNYYALKI